MGAFFALFALSASTRRWHALAVFAALAGLGVASCQNLGDPSVDSTAVDPNAKVGSVSFELALGGKYQFDAITYDITGGTFHRTDTVNVSSSATFSTLVSGIPAGSGYAATLTAQDVAHKLMPCSGSATFDVTGAATVPVAVHMTCHQVVTPPPPPPPPPAVPVPRAAVYALGAALLVLGASRLRRPTA